MTKLLISSLFLLTFFAPFWWTSAEAEEGFTYEVRTGKDGFVEGNLRLTLHETCHVSKGDDLILFSVPSDLPPGAPLVISVDSPLVIPRDCQGKVTIRGNEERETILVSPPIPGGEEEGSSCSLIVYANGNRIENLTFLGNSSGAAVCLFGRENEVAKSRFGKSLGGMSNPNRYGVVISDHFTSEYPGMDGRNNQVLDSIVGPDALVGIFSRAEGSLIARNQVELTKDSGIVQLRDKAEIVENKVARSFRNGLNLEGSRLEVRGNEIFSNAWSGIRIVGKNSRIFRNRILANGGCPRGEEIFYSQPVDCFDGKESGGPGILIEGESEGILVGGDSFEKDRNIIQYNRDGGVVIVGQEGSVRHKITHNTISKNYGAEPDLDLVGDGLTPNDPGDLDEGPNHLLNFIEWFQTFPLAPSPKGDVRYWVWGYNQGSSSVTSVEMYEVPPEDRKRERRHGGGENFIAESLVESKRGVRMGPFSTLSGFEDSLLTMLSFDNEGNTSEFSTNVRIGRDTDMDGIVDSLETGDGTVTSGGSSPTLPDSDGDNLPDPVEDKNRNGKWDKALGETSAFNPDSDGDALSDWVETHGDGIYSVGIDTDPLNPDTDGDGIKDGDEDKNRNGIYEPYLGETNPLSADSDGDGVLDGKDNCPVIPNPGQEPWYCKPLEVKPFDGGKK